LVSTISFSGSQRMDYSLPGYNVLKDHRWPVQAPLERGFSAANAPSLSANPTLIPQKTKSPASQAGPKQLPVGTLLAKQSNYNIVNQVR